MVVKLERRDDLALLTLDRQEALNALSFSIIDEIGAALDRVADLGVRALLITGAGAKAFCAGADIKELRDRPLSALALQFEELQLVWIQLFRLQQENRRSQRSSGLRICAGNHVGDAVLHVLLFCLRHLRLYQVFCMEQVGHVLFRRARTGVALPSCRDGAAGSDQKGSA